MLVKPNLHLSFPARPQFTPITVHVSSSVAAVASGPSECRFEDTCSYRFSFFGEFFLFFLRGEEREGVVAVFFLYIVMRMFSLSLSVFYFMGLLVLSSEDYFLVFGFCLRVRVTVLKIIILSFRFFSVF